ncbi:MAG TPA: hypothetical protein PKI46_08515 [Bacteroidales bacterium]|nr:hypothetical protein [Bacteroidales bacterium]
MNPIEIVQSLPKHMQALYSDAVLFLSNESTIATPERKTLLLNNIQFIKAQIEALEKAIG